MKKIILVIAVLFFCTSGYAQRVNVNVHVYGGNQRLYFKHPHAWMVNQGYHYHRGGYYVRHGAKVYPVRREYYNHPGRGHHRYHKNYGHKYHKKYHRRGKGH